jgi:hypothetical protein
MPKNYKALKQKLLKKPAIKASYDELAKAHFTRPEQKMINLIDNLVYAVGEFKYYDETNFKAYDRIMKEQHLAMQAIFKHFQKYVSTNNHQTR